MDAGYLAFMGAAALVISVPGPDFAVVLRNGVSGGRTVGMATAFGTATGILVHCAAAVGGLSALLAASATAFTVIKIAGAIYLIWLGAQSLLSAWRGGGATGGVRSGGGSSARGDVPGHWRAYRQGLLTNVLNPKVAVFFLTFLPQFLEPGVAVPLRMAQLGLTFWVMTLGWLVVMAVATDTLRGVLRRGRVRRAIDAAMGTVFVGFGLKVATSRAA